MCSMSEMKLSASSSPHSICFSRLSHSAVSSGERRASGSTLTSDAEGLSLCGERFPFHELTAPEILSGGRKLELSRGREDFMLLKENACLNCDYYDACHFSQGENGESCRYTPKLSGEKVWALLDGGGENE